MSDLISRQAAIDAMNQIYCHVEMIRKRPVTKGEQALFLDMRETIKALPSAEPRKKGKWIFIHPLQADDEGAYICSNCHRGDWDIKPTDKYCKFCGMAMDIYATLLP